MIYVLVAVGRSLRNAMGKMNKNFKLALVLVLLLALVLLLSFSLNRLPSTDNISTDTSEELISKEVTFQVWQNDQWMTIYRIQDRPIALVGDYFIIGSELYSPHVQVVAYNMKTGEETVLYNKFNDGNKAAISVTQIYQIGNTVFFLISGYWSSEEMYYIDLPIEQNKIHKLEGSSGGDIREIEGNYWLWDGGGDVCISYGSYSLFDPKSKKVIPVGKYYNDCGTGNFLIVQKDKVFNLHSINDKVGDEFGTTTYTHVSWIDIQNPQIEKDLIPKSKMPAFIHDIEYDEESNLLLLTGNEKYVFDIDNKTLVKKDFVKPKDSAKYQGTYMDSTISKLKEIKLPEGYRFDFSDSKNSL